MFKKAFVTVVSIACLCGSMLIPVSAATTVKTDTSSYHFSALNQSYIIKVTVGAPNGKWTVATSDNYSIVTPQYVSHKGNDFFFRVIAKGYGNAQIHFLCNGVKASTPITVGVDMRTLIDTPSLFAFDTNSADGVRIALLANYKGSKTVNYYTVNFSAYNSVGDPIVDQITGKSKFSIKVVGPVKTGEQFALYNIFAYSAVCSRIVIDRIDLQFSDGSVISGTYPYSTTQNTDDAINEKYGLK